MKKYNEKLWDWMDKGSSRGVDFKSSIVVALLLLIVPIALTLLVQWDPAFGVDEDGDPAHWGYLFLLVPYWLGLYFAHEQWKTSKRLNELIDGLLDERRLELITEKAKQKMDRGEEHASFNYYEADERVKWFGIK